MVSTSSNMPSDSTSEGVTSTPEPDAGLLLAGVIGLEMLGPLRELRTLVDEAVASDALDSTYAEAMGHSIERALTLARRSQQLGRVSVRKAEQARERFSLDAMLREMADERENVLRARGGTISVLLRPTEVIEEPGLMSTLLEAALDWAVERGDRVTANLTRQDWPERELLIVDCDSGSAPLRALDEDCLNWRLLGTAARTMGAKVERNIRPTGGTLTICFPLFPEMVKRESRYSNLDFETRGDPLNPSQKAGAALRILVVCSDSHIREEVGWLCMNIRATPRFVPDDAEAIAVLGQSVPHLVIADRPNGPHQPDGLLETVRRLSPSTAFVELVSGDHPMEMGVWGAMATTRLNRERLAQQLPSVLALELGRNQ